MFHSIGRLIRWLVMQGRIQYANGGPQLFGNNLGSPVLMKFEEVYHISLSSLISSPSQVSNCFASWKSPLYELHFIYCCYLDIIDLFLGWKPDFSLWGYRGIPGTLELAKLPMPVQMNFCMCFRPAFQVLELVRVQTPPKILNGSKSGWANWIRLIRGLGKFHVGFEQDTTGTQGASA